MYTSLVIFSVIVLRLEFAHGTFPYVLPATVKDLGISMETPSWIYAPWRTDDKGKSDLEVDGEQIHIDERLLKHTWNFIKKLKGKEAEEPKKETKKKQKKKASKDTGSGSPLLILADDPADNTTQSSSTTVAPSLLIIDTGSLPVANDVVNTASVDDKEEKPSNDSESVEEADDEEEEDEEDEEYEEDEGNDEKETDDDPEEIILDTNPKGPDGSDAMEPAELDMLGKKADLYLRLNKAHKSAKDFVSVFKGVYRDYVTNRPHIGIEFGTRGRSYDENSAGVNRMGETWSSYEQHGNKYAPSEPKVFMSSYNVRDYHPQPYEYYTFIPRQHRSRPDFYYMRDAYGLDVDYMEYTYPYDIPYATQYHFY